MQKTVETNQDVVDLVERGKWKRIGLTLVKDWRLYVLLIPMLAFLICFKYMPIYGILTGFKWGADNDPANYLWNGMFWFNKIFFGTTESAIFWRAFRNTFVNSMYGLIIGFPIPIILALLFSEVKVLWYRSALQVAAYLPHFISVSVVTTIINLWCVGPTESLAAGWLYTMLESMGLLNYTVDGVEMTYKYSVLFYGRFFRPIYQISGVWEGAGYGSIVYFAAILAISPTSYEAARIDGASKIQQIRYVTFPGMAPTLTIMLIMRIGHILNIGYEKVLLLVGNKSDAWETADVVSTFVYRMTGKDPDYKGATYAQLGIVGDLFNSVIAMFLVLGANAISRRVSSTSLF